MSKGKLKLGRRSLDWSVIHWFHGQNGRVQATYNDPKNEAFSPLSDLGFEIVPAKDDKPQTVRGRTTGGAVYDLYGGWSDGEVCRVSNVETVAQLQVSPNDRAAADPKATEERIAYLIDLAIQERRDQLAYWEANEFTKAMALVIRPVWFPDGEPCEIMAIGNECYRRSLAIPGAIYRRSLPDPVAGEPLDSDGLFRYPMEVMVKEWDSESDRIFDHMDENTRKDSSRVRLSDVDLLNTARQLYLSDPYSTSESELMRRGHLKRGTAQKLNEVLTADYKFRELGLVRRCMLPAPEGAAAKVFDPKGYVPLSGLGASELRNIRNSKHWTNKDVKLRGVGVATYQRYIKEVVTGTKGSEVVPPFTADEVAKLKDSPVRIVAEIATAIRSGNKSFFKLLDNQAEMINDLLNDLYPAPEDGDAPADAVDETADAVDETADAVDETADAVDETADETADASAE